MGILKTLFRSRDKPQNRTAGSGYSFFFGGTTAGKAVNEMSAMQMTAVYSCVRILAEAVAGLPLHLYRYTRADSKEKAIEHPLYQLLHDEPNPEMSSFVFRETLMTHLLLWGNAYAQIIRNGKGEVIGLYPLMPNRMSVDRDREGRLWYTYTRMSEEAPTMKETTVRLYPYDVLHIPGLGFDGLVGYSPIAMAKNAIGMGLACEEYGARFFANGAAPSGVLEHPGTIKDPQKIRESWNATFKGSGNAHKVAVLEEGMKFSSIGIAPEQAQFLETRKFQINEIARIFRVPPHMVGDLEKSSFSNIEQQSLEFVKYTLEPWIVRWEQSIMRVLLSPDEKSEYFVKFNLEGLREDFSLSRDEKYKLLADGVDISSYAGGLSWQNTIDELATKLSFEVAKSSTKYVNTYTPQIGSIINFFTNVEIFRGIVIDVDDGSETVNKYTVCDFGWYLNKSKETYQFNNMTAYKAIKKVCEDFNIPIDSIPELNTEIKQIYVDKAVSDIISNILELCGGGYNYDMTPQGLRIYKYGDIYAYPEFRITPNTPLIYSPSLRGGVSHSVSIEDMKNSIKVITEADNVYTVQTVLKDTDSIYKFGVLQEVVKIDPEKENANTVAKNKLAELNKQSETFSFEMIEAVDSYTRAGMVMDIDDSRYLIEGTSHSITNGIHHVKVDLRKFV